MPESTHKYTPDETKNPWKIKRSATKYDNNWIKVTEHEVVNPAGNRGIYGEVHFKNYALGIVPLTKDYCTYLIGQYRFPLKEYSWEIPMGGGNLNEVKEEGAKRELLEETGIEAEKWSLITKVHTSNSVTDETGYIFVAQDITIGTPEPEETEILTLRKVTMEEAIELVMQDKITDAISVVGLLKTKKLIDEGLI